MSLLAKIKEDQVAARKAAIRDKVKISLLTTLLGELESDSVGKVGDNLLTDADVISKVKKFTKSLNELVAVCSEEQKEQPQTELAILAEYLPKQLTESELETIISEAGVSNMGAAMGFLKKNYAGLYDGKLASTVAKRIF